MTWVAAGGTAILTGLSIFGSQRAKSKERERLRLETSRQITAADREQDDLFVQAEAARQQQLLIGERERLAEDAAAESRRQSLLAAEQVDVTVGPTDPLQRSRTRRRFFDTGDGGVL